MFCDTISAAHDVIYSNDEPRGRHRCYRLVVEFTITCAISASPEMLMITKMISNLSTDMRNMIGK